MQPHDAAFSSPSLPLSSPQQDNWDMNLDFETVYFEGPDAQGTPSEHSAAQHQLDPQPVDYSNFSSQDYNQGCPSDHFSWANPYISQTPHLGLFPAGHQGSIGYDYSQQVVHSQPYAPQQQVSLSPLAPNAANSQTCAPEDFDNRYQQQQHQHHQQQHQQLLANFVAAAALPSPAPPSASSFKTHIGAPSKRSPGKKALLHPYDRLSSNSGNKHLVEKKTHLPSRDGQGSEVDPIVVGDDEDNEVAIEGFKGVNAKADSGEESDEARQARREKGRAVDVQQPNSVQNHTHPISSSSSSRSGSSSHLECSSPSRQHLDRSSSSSSSSSSSAPSVGPKTPPAPLTSGNSGRSSPLGSSTTTFSSLPPAVNSFIPPHGLQRFTRLSFNPYPLPERTQLIHVRHIADTISIDLLMQTGFFGNEEDQASGEIIRTFVQEIDVQGRRTGHVFLLREVLEFFEAKNDTYRQVEFYWEMKRRGQPRKPSLKV